ncbi:MAG: LLM class flavin-dependent oxidoreductase [Candidatus Aquiluna sp.]|jgi:probable LLM family oxidoreductase|nr:LLM class flavin-dependent oxidoreductase [Aquiluna sp.]
MKNITFGLDTFGNVSLDESGNPVSAAQVIRDVLAQGQLADELGLNNFNIGEHHRDDFAVTAPDTILAGLATTTKNIILGTGVTVLSSEDPVRVYQRFATIDALSNGRVQITAGRGSFIESFPLFGYELSDYNDLFEQKLELLVELLKEEPVTWSGSMRAGLSNQQVYPKTEGGKIPLRVGVGGSPESVLRAARLNIPMALAIIGGDPARFEPFARLYKETLAKLGMPELPVSVHSPGHVAETDDQAIEEAWPGYEASFGKIGLERGWGPTSKEHFLSEVYHGSMYVGSPETVAKKIVHALSSVGASRFDLKYDMGPLSHSKLTKSIELYATKVVPMVREMLETA